MNYKELENTSYVHTVGATVKDSPARTERLRTDHRLYLTGYTIEESSRKTFSENDK